LFANFEIAKGYNFMNERITLSAKTHFGIEILKADGRVWVVLEHRDKVLGLAGREGILIESVATSARRWVRIGVDPDFKINFLGRN
jgi:hypothetical protein